MWVYDIAPCQYRGVKKGSSWRPQPLFQHGVHLQATSIWVNFITTSLFSRTLGIMVNKRNHHKMAELFRLVTYYNLPRTMPGRLMPIMLGCCLVWCFTIENHVTDSLGGIMFHQLEITNVLKQLEIMLEIP